MTTFHTHDTDPATIHDDATSSGTTTGDAAIGHAAGESGGDTLDMDRIDHLVEPNQARDATVVVVGLGSGGFPVMQQLAMSGVRRWHLFDPDTLDGVNLVKHPALRAELGTAKVDIAARWLRDRNPNAVIHGHVEDSRTSAALEAAIQDADLVVVAVDNRGSREQLNELAIRFATPMVVGQVFRGGFGGEVYAFLPGDTACHDCLGAVCEKQGWVYDPVTGPDAEEQRRVYGMGERDFQRSGLACDLGMIASLHASVCLSVLFGADEGGIPKHHSNWFVLATRPKPGIFSASFQTRQLRIRPQRDCAHGCGSSAWPGTAAAILGVQPRVTADTIARAWRLLSRHVHPDRHAQASSSEQERAHRRFLALSEARDELLGALDAEATTQTTAGAPR